MHSLQTDKRWIFNVIFDKRCVQEQVMENAWKTVYVALDVSRLKKRPAGAFIIVQVLE